MLPAVPPAGSVPIGPPAAGIPVGPPAVGVPVGPPAAGVPLGPPAAGIPIGGPAGYPEAVAFQHAMVPEGTPEALPTRANPWPIISEVAKKYEHSVIVGVGVYGTVYKIKNLKIEEDYGQGVPANVLREVVCLREFTHPNVVELIEVFTTGVQDYSLIFEFVEGDLHKLLKSFRREDSIMPMELAKRYSFELLNGLHACHVRLILHRDLKPQNCLIGKDGLKICDFGLARMFSLPVRCYTHKVITLWYRSPEIILGTQSYGPEVDMWSTGCIIAEMLTGFPTFPGDSEIGTVLLIFQTCGTPTEQSWPGLHQLDEHGNCRLLPHYKPTFPKWPSNDLQGIYKLRPDMGAEGLELLRNLLPLNPKARISARRAKNSSFPQPQQTSAGEQGGA